MTSRSIVAVAVITVLVALARGQTTPAAPAPPATPTPAPAPAPTTTAPGATQLPDGPVAPAWSFAASAYTYMAPDDREYVQPIFTADRDWLHLELRYNYESLDTGSAWVGYNFSAGDELTVEFTPMIGGVFGDTHGFAPGYEVTLGWRQLELYSEGEYLFDSNDDSASFFYSWSELTLTPVDSFRFGLVTQRTRLYDSERELQRGLLVGFSGKTWDVTGYLFDPDEDKPTFVFALGFSF